MLVELGVDRFVFADDEVADELKIGVVDLEYLLLLLFDFDSGDLVLLDENGPLEMLPSDLSVEFNESPSFKVSASGLYGTSVVGDFMESSVYEGNSNSISSSEIVEMVGEITLFDILGETEVEVADDDVLKFFDLFLNVYGELCDCELLLFLSSASSRE